MKHRRIYLLLLLGALALGITAWAAVWNTAYAAPLSQDATPTPQPQTSGSSNELPVQMSIADSVCLDCHGQPGQTYPLANGENLDLYVPAEAHQNSIHGQLGYACVQCHTQVGNYPHPPFQAADLREVTLKMNETCQRCHTGQYDQAQDGVHAVFLAQGNRSAAVCTDCHTAHDVRQLTDAETGQTLPDARVWIPTTCARCHSAIYEKYKTSVHGAALIGEGNPDVPTCIDCHGVHNIEDPTTSYFRLNSPQICAKCHTNPDVVGKYGLSTDVLNTYVADFHGTTVALFEKQSPDAETNKPVCFDCHGVHDIARADDPQKGLQVRTNLLARCQVCHPDATDSFPDSWTSHYIPSADKNPWIYYVNLFYKFFIPGVLGGMGLLVVMDIGRTNLNRYRAWKRRKEAISEQQSAVSEQQSAISEQAAEVNEQPAAVSEQPAPVSEPAVESSEPEAAVSDQAAAEDDTEAQDAGPETK